MKKMRMKKNTFQDIICSLFIALFVYAALNKLFERPLFAAQMRKAHLLESVSESMSYIVPIVELLLAALLVTTKYKLKALIASTGLMLLFTVYIITILSINKETPCGCGGIIQKLNWQQHIIMNSLFILLGVAGVWLERKTSNESLKEQIPIVQHHSKITR